MKKYNHLIIDGTNLYWRNTLARTKQYLTYKNEEINISGITGSLSSLNKFERFFLKDNGFVWILFDNPDSTIYFRKDIDPSYKSFREEIPENVQVVGKYLVEILKVYKDNYSLVFAKQLEADDLVYPLLQSLDEDNNILLISTDLDWARSISDNCDWFNWDKLYTRDIFKLEYNFYPTANKVKLYKALTGDKSDSIPNPFFNKVKGIDWRFPRKILIPIIQNCNDIDDFFYKLYSNRLGLSKMWLSRFKKIEARIRLNYKLVDFNIPFSYDIKKEIIECKYSKNKLDFWFNLFDISLKHLNNSEQMSPSTFFTWETARRIY